MKAFKKVLDGAHTRGMKVIMDLVINHTSTEHEWFKKSRERIEPYTDYYIWRPAKKNGKLPNNWDSLFEGKAWKYDEVRKEYYMHLFAIEQADLNMDNPLVREEVKKVLAETKVTMIHRHEHYSLGNLWGIVNDVTKRWITGLVITVVILLVALAYCVDYAFTSELFLGKSYREICNSEYITKEERDAMIKDVYAVSACPRKYEGKPKALRDKIRQNKAILRERKSRAMYENDKFPTEPRVEF